MPNTDTAVLEFERSSEPSAQAIAVALRATERRPGEGREADLLAAVEARRAGLFERTDLVPGHRSLTIADACRKASKSATDAIVLFRLLRELRPLACLELGTNLGISGAYQAAALRLNGHGRLITLEGHKGRAQIAQETFDDLGLDDIVDLRVGRFDETLGGALADGVDYAFVDGDHNEEPTLDYFERISAAATPGAVIVFDDIRWSDGMARAWERIVADERVATGVALERMGVCALAGATSRRP